MKKGFTIALAIAWCLAWHVNAQNNQAPGISKDNPFADIGVDEPVLGINGYAEMPSDSLVVIAGWVYNKHTGSVVDKEAPNPSDTLFQLFGNQQLYRWLSVDPVVHPYQSPYVAMDNNPILYVDPDGRSVWFFRVQSGINAGVPLLSAGIYYEQGFAKDDIGYTSYTIKSSNMIYGYNKTDRYKEGAESNFGDDGEYMYGGNADILDFAILWDWNAKTFEEALVSKVATTNISGLPIDVSIGDGQIGGSLGISAGVGVEKINPDVIDAISMTYDEHSDLEITGYSYELTVTRNEENSYKGDLYVQYTPYNSNEPGPKILLGEVKSNHYDNEETRIWKTEAYIDAENDQ